MNNKLTHIFILICLIILLISLKNNINYVYVLLTLLFIYIFYIIYDCTTTINTNKQYKTHKKEINNFDYESLLSDSNNSYSSSIITDIINSSNNSINIPVNKYLLNTQFHPDYRDVITAFNNLVPGSGSNCVGTGKGSTFNISNLPQETIVPETKDVKKLIKSFMKELNNNIFNVVTDFRNSNTGWDEAVKEQDYQDGWEKTYNSLNVQTNLYHKAKKRCKVDLVDINKVIKHETDDEIQYIVHMILKKQNTNDQIFIKIFFLQNKRGITDENNFNKNIIELPIRIENIFIIGYLSMHKTFDSQIFDGNHTQYMEYDQLDNNNMTDPKYIQKYLIDKYQQRQKDNDYRTAMLDEEGQIFHSTMKNINEYENIKNTRTIFDDMNKPKVFT